MSTRPSRPPGGGTSLSRRAEGGRRPSMHPVARPPVAHQADKRSERRLESHPPSPGRQGTTAPRARARQRHGAGIVHLRPRSNIQTRTVHRSSRKPFFPRARPLARAHSPRVSGPRYFFYSGLPQQPRAAAWLVPLARYDLALREGNLQSQSPGQGRSGWPGHGDRTRRGARPRRPAGSPGAEQAFHTPCRVGPVAAARVPLTRSSTPRFTCSNVVQSRSEGTSSIADQRRREDNQPPSSRGLAHDRLAPPFLHGLEQPQAPAHQPSSLSPGHEADAPAASPTTEQAGGTARRAPPACRRQSARRPRKSRSSPRSISRFAITAAPRTSCQLYVKPVSEAADLRRPGLERPDHTRSEPDHAGEREVAAREPLGDRHQVGLDVVHVGAERSPRGSRAATSRSPA